MSPPYATIENNYIILIQEPKEIRMLKHSYQIVKSLNNFQCESVKSRLQF